MILFSLGLPGRFAEWCDGLIFHLAQHALGSVELTQAGTVEELGLAMLRTGASHFVVSLRQPGARLRAALADTDQRCLVALDDPRDSVADLVVDCGLNFAAGTRSVATSYAMLLRYASLPGALVLTVGQEGRDPVATATAISRHFDLPLTAANISEVVSKMADAGTTFKLRDLRSWWDGREAAEVAMVEGALGAFVNRFDDDNLRQITWSPELFFVGDDRTEGVTRVVDITGRARCLLFGPFIALPPGSWYASVVLGFSKEAAEINYLVEIFAEKQLAHTSLKPGREGAFEVTLAFSIEESLDQYVQVRVVNETAAFDGVLVLGNVTLVRHTIKRSGGLTALKSILRLEEQSTSTG